MLGLIFLINLTKLAKKDFDYILKSNLEAPFFIVQKLIKFLNKKIQA